MKKDLKQYIEKLRAYGIENDIPNVTYEVGKFLNMLIQVKKPKTILEIGCANGYSTIWMAEAAEKVGAQIHTIDHSAPTYEEAKKNLTDVGFSEVVEFHFGDAREVIPQMDTSLQFDLVFVDGQKASYLDFWNVIQDRLTLGAVIVFDDMIAFPEKTKQFHDHILTAEGIDQLILPIDQNDGILLAIKH
jgi:predicted O-methyltransferase YrrM